ncbi:thymidylate synthase [Ramlibacter sp. XY19]|uniref:thymidylate synthase n=1 Tax=Ramlibacter paludis TaxID=2908000 RepID=UPI0023DC6DDA|nr:thymidylate synthase [Ramlibacter paludis]MCG2592972.1 thymidylate synthase [Ramlibacter paludis]
MREYLELVQQVFEQGQWQENRTGVRTLSVPGAMMRMDLKKGFPAVTTKKLAFKSAIGEMVGFLRGSRSAADFRKLGCKVWDQNANENKQWLENPFRQGPDDLGPVYGVQWRQWPAFKMLSPDFVRIESAKSAGYRVVGHVQPYDEEEVVILHKDVDQLRHCLDTIIKDPSSRRILFHGWNWAQLDEMALPPCHLLYQFLVNKGSGEISLCLYVRSNDLGLGTPFNLTEGAALLHLVGRLTGYTPRWFTYFIGDAHIYENHVDMLQEQLKREPFPPPRLVIADRVPEYSKTGIYEPEWLEKVEPSDFTLEGYQHHPPLTAPMAV